MDSKKNTLRSSTSEFLIFTTDSKEDSIEVRYQNETVWLSQKMMAKLFDCSTDNISFHLKKIFSENELIEDNVILEFYQKASDGKKYKTTHYNLDAIISVGYRINSSKATQFRRWATNVLKEFAIKGFVVDKERLKNGSFLNKDYFEELLEEIREIRASERRFYQKITDIYSTAMDYDRNSPVTKTFFATVQNKLHYAITGKTAGELIKERADSAKPHMGLKSWKKSPKGKIYKSDVTVAKNYLEDNELKSLNRIVTMYLDYAEDQAEKQIPMTMEDWKNKLDAFLKFNERDILNNPGKITKEASNSFAKSEWEKFRVVQDKYFESDFDKEIKKQLKNSKE